MMGLHFRQRNHQIGAECRIWKIDFFVMGKLFNPRHIVAIQVDKVGFKLG